MIEEVRRVVREGNIDWTVKLFKFVGDDPSKAIILHAGGIYNAYRNDDMTDGDKKALKKAGISLKDAWKENLNAKCNYVFRVVDNDNPNGGNQIAIETTSLGKKVKKVIKDAMTSLGREEGNPFRNPYCIRWEYDKNAKQFNEKYNAIKMDTIQLSRRVEELINEEPADISNIIKRGNIKELRTSMEAHYIGPKGLLDWDFIFHRAEELQADLDDKPFHQDEDAQPPKRTSNKKKARKAKPVEPDPEPEDEDEDEEQYECDDCNNVMSADETVCSECGRDYGDEEDEDDEPPPPPVKSRSKKSKSASKPKGKKSNTFKPKF
jgi:hypothetical protein